MNRLDTLRPNFRPILSGMDNLSAADTLPTRDLNCAAFLLSVDAPLVEVLPVAPGRVEYVFSGRKHCQDLLKSFCSGSALINARRFCEGLSRARDLRDGLCMSAKPAAPHERPTHEHKI